MNDSFTRGKVEAIVELVFCLLKPEIDKAMKRSSVARLRSVKKKNGTPIPQSHKRKAAKKSGLFEVVDIAELAKLLKVSDIQECDCDIEKSEIPIKENRRERRRREQELRRQSRRASGAKAYGKR